MDKSIRGSKTQTVRKIVKLFHLAHKPIIKRERTVLLFEKDKGNTVLFMYILYNICVNKSVRRPLLLYFSNRIAVGIVLKKTAVFIADFLLIKPLKELVT